MNRSKKIIVKRVLPHVLQVKSSYSPDLIKFLKSGDWDRHWNSLDKIWEITFRLASQEALDKKVKKFLGKIKQFGEVEYREPHGSMFYDKVSKLKVFFREIKGERDKKYYQKKLGTDGKIYKVMVPFKLHHEDWQKLRKLGLYRDKYASEKVLKKVKKWFEEKGVKVRPE